MINQLIELITIGLPFCVFKVVTGLYLNQHWLTALGVIDLVINLTNLVTILSVKKRVLHACSLSFVLSKIKKPPQDIKYKWQDLGNSIDVLLSFTLVAYMIGWGGIVHIPSWQLQIWNVSVVFNVFGAGYSRLADSIKELKA
jgi:hypothetical protein